jgi:uncharacterized protein (TIRG00374 family)
VSLGVAGLLAAVLLYWSIRGIQWRDVGRTIAGASFGVLALSCAIATCTLLLRAARWQTLLNARGAVAFGPTFWATSAGYFANNFLPARAGELVRTVMIQARSSLSLGYVLATALSERVADAIVLVLVASAVLMIVPVQSSWLSAAARPFAVLGIVGAVTIAVLPLTGTFAGRVAAALPLPTRVRTGLAVLLDEGVDGLRAFHSTRRLAVFLTLTAVISAGDVLALLTTSAALRLHLAIAPAFLLLAAIGLAGALPSTPGYIGIYQFVAVTILVPFGFDRGDAIAFILVMQAASYAVTAVWGAIGFSRYRRTRLPSTQSGAGPSVIANVQ